MTKKLARTIARSGSRPHPSRRERTRDKLIRAGESLLAHRSIDGVSVDDVVGAAAVGKGSFYNHFVDKEAFASQIVDSVRGDLEHRVRTANAGVEDAAARLARGVVIYLRAALEHPDRSRILLRLFPHETLVSAPINRGMAQDIRDGIRQRRFRLRALDDGVIFVLGVGTALMARSIDEPASRSVSADATHVLALMLHGLGMTAGEALKVARASVRDLLEGPPIGALAELTQHSRSAIASRTGRERKPSRTRAN